MKNRILYFLLILFILSDAGYSFVQHLHKPLDGDMSRGVIPVNTVKNIFQDPFGISVITQNAVYPNPNRFFAHYTFSNYFQNVPFFLQHFFSPIDSLYLSCAIAKIIIQLSLLFLLGFYITGTTKVLKEEFLIAVALITPLFQTNGYVGYMGIIDSSVTYTFFYALPCCLLLLFYLPFFNTSFYGKEFISNKFILLLLFLFTVVLTLNGPLLPGIILIISFLYILYHFKLHYTISEFSFVSKTKMALRKISRPHLFFFVFISLLSLYSLYIGKNNSEFINDIPPLSTRYDRLPFGLYYWLTQKLGVPLLIIMICVNAFLIHKNYKNETGKKILHLLKWIVLFSVLYIILLPLGGYRHSRPNIIRCDSVMPITIALIFIYGLSALFLINNLKNIGKKVYVFILIGFSFIYTWSDEPEFTKNNCEKQALQKIADSRDKIVLLENDCNVMSWEKITDPKESENNAELFQYWGITKEKKLFYQK